MFLWLEVSQDKYELPIMVCESSDELAIECHTTAINIRSQVSKFNKGAVKTCRYRKVKVDDKLDEAI